MGLRYKLHRKAFIELDQATLWYSKKGGKKLASNFLREYRKLRDRILKNPLQFPEIESNCRQATFRKFPYVIIYYTSDTEIFVLAVFHTSRNFDDWKSRE